MVDVTFPFIILLGGLLVGIVTARVRRHTGWRKALDILVAAICGPTATTFWMRVVPRLFPSSPDQPYLSRDWAFFLADVLWFSPVIGGFIGVTAVAIGSRLAGHGPARPQESWGEKVGDGLRVVGWVYAVISLALIVGVVILAFAFEFDRPADAPAVRRSFDRASDHPLWLGNRPPVPHARRATGRAAPALRTYAFDCPCGARMLERTGGVLTADVARIRPQHVVGLSGAKAIAIASRLRRTLTHTKVSSSGLSRGPSSRPRRHQDIARNTTMAGSSA